MCQNSHLEAYLVIIWQIITHYLSLCDRSNVSILTKNSLLAIWWRLANFDGNRLFWQKWHFGVLISFCQFYQNAIYTFWSTRWCENSSWGDFLSWRRWRKRSYVNPLDTLFFRNDTLAPSAPRPNSSGSILVPGRPWWASRHSPKGTIPHPSPLKEEVRPVRRSICPKDDFDQKKRTPIWSKRVFWKRARDFLIKPTKWRFSTKCGSRFWPTCHYWIQNRDQIASLVPKQDPNMSKPSSCLKRDWLQGSWVCVHALTRSKRQTSCCIILLSLGCTSWSYSQDMTLDLDFDHFSDKCRFGSRPDPDQIWTRSLSKKPVRFG